MSPNSSERPSIVNVAFGRDDQGNFGCNSIVQARSGDLLELTFSDVVGIGLMADLDVNVKGDSVRLDGVRDIVELIDGHRLIGSFELCALLHAVHPGRSTVDITVLGHDGSAAGIVAVSVEVA